MDDGISNPTSNRPFEDILAARLSRRKALVGGTVAAAAFIAGESAVDAKGRGRKPGKGRKPGRGRGPRNGAPAPQPQPQPQRPVIGFEPVPVADGNGPEVVVSKDYVWMPLIPWGTPIQPDGPAFSWPPSDPAVAEKQIGIGHDGMWYFGDDKGGMLCINHEFGTTPHVLGKDEPESSNDVRIMQAVHGVSVVRIENEGGQWKPVASPNNRRITGNTPVEFPKSPTWGWHDKLLRNKADNPYLGTLNNCANGYTPWGTYLTCEENFNGYFGATDPNWEPNEKQARYGLSATGFGYGWHDFDPRFDLSNPDYANEANRFGWVVEIDPNDASKPAMKHPALGRFKHEGATVVEGQGGRIVVYMGDDERNDYIYKYVSRTSAQSLFARGKSPLDHGSLFVAKFDDNGGGEWIELTIENPALAAEFHDQAEILTYTRLAADVVGATPMDRPEWSSVHPDGSVYFTLTNNSRRTTPNGPNPLAPNPNGHIIEIKDSEQHVGTSFTWEIFVICDDLATTEDAFASPDGLWIDPDGRIFIQTDGGQPQGLNDQMVVADAQGEFRRLLTGPTGCEITGIAVTPDRKTMFANVQHPGDGDPALTNFPAPTDGKTVPRDATMVIRRKDGGIVGS